MADDLKEELRLIRCYANGDARCTCNIGQDAADRIERLEAALSEMTRRRDEWRKKAEGFDAVRLALREKVGTPWPPHMSRLLWAGIAADEKKRADDAEAALQAADELAESTRPFAACVFNDNGDVTVSQGNLRRSDWLRLDRTATAYRKARGGRDMTRKEALAELIEKVEAGKTEERYRLTAKAFSQSVPHSFVWAAMDGSLDAAKALHEAVLPGFGWTAGGGAVRVYKLNGLPCSEHVSATPTPARSWLLAILRAIHAQEGDT